MKKYFLSLTLLFVILTGLVPGHVAFASAADDEFVDETLDEKWAWTRENAGSWSLTGDALQMDTLNEDLFEYTATAPLLLQDLVDDFGSGNKYEITVKLGLIPAANYQQAGIVLWQDDNNFVQLNVQFYGDLEIEIYREVSNDGHAYFVSVPRPENNTFFLKLRRYETTYTGWVSADGIVWVMVGQFVNTILGPTKMGVTAYNASGAASIPVLFDYFHATELTAADAPPSWQGWWRCIYTYAPNVCPTGLMSPFVVTDQTNNTVTNLGNVLFAKIICRHIGCSSLRDVYFEASFSFSWTAHTSGARTVEWAIKAEDFSAPNHVPNSPLPCGTGFAGECGETLTGIIPSSELNNDPADSHNVEIELAKSGATGLDSFNWVWGATFGFVSLDDSNCSESYLILSEGDEMPIDSTLEFPAADHPYQHQDVQTGVIYRIQTLDGPWNDSVHDRYDAAISWDGTTYTPISELVEDALCVDYDPDNPALLSIYLEAPSDDFYIRANDGAGLFADNDDLLLSPLAYTLSVAVQITPDDCSDFTYDPEEDWLASVVLDPTSEGIDSSVEFVIGEWYVIETASGPWHDGSDPSDRYDALSSWDEGFDTERKFTVGAEGYDYSVQCREDIDGMHERVFFQGSDSALWLRVNDLFGTFSDNTGMLGINIYSATYDRSEELCELKFTIGDILKEDSVNAMQENGKWVGSSSTLSPEVGNPTVNMEPGGWYMIETSGGPWFHVGGADGPSSYDMALSGRLIESLGGTTLDSGWQYTDDWIWADCVVETDTLGHRRVYFQAQAPGRFDTYIRVNDTSDWLFNYGSERFTLYAVNNNVEEDEDCSNFSYEEVEPPLARATVYGNNSPGVYISNVNMIDPEMTFAIVVDEGAWQEMSGGSDMYDMQISDDFGETWQPWNEADFRLCYDDEGDHRYVLYVPGGGYTVRVDSSTFSDNTGYRVVSVYSVGNEQDCFGQYDPYPVDPFEWIPEDREQGIVITGQEGLPDTTLVVGEVYIVEIQDGPWTTPELSRYDAALSSDGGATWYSMENHPQVVCFGTDYLGWHDKAAFVVETEQQWKIRVNDSAGEFLDNGGSLAYALFTSLSNVDDGDDGWDAIVYDCTNACVRPDSWIDVPQWIDYSGCRIQQFFAWCPDNTDMLVAFIESLDEKEPFGTISEVQTLIDTVQTEIDSYDWSGSVYGTEGVLGSDTGGESVIAKLLPTLPANSPWRGGDVVTWSWSGGGTPYSTSCTTILTQYIGPFAGGGVCWVSNIAEDWSLLYWVQFIIDLSAIFMAVSYLIGVVKNPGGWLGLNER